MIALTTRNLKAFYRDRSAVFFSLLASLIIIGLYVMFLGDVYTSDFNELANAREIMDSWVMAGLLATTSFTTTMGAFGIMVNDRAQKISKDFYSSPVRRSTLAGGYVISALILGFIASIITLCLAEIYIVANGGALLSVQAMLRVLILILLADVTNAAIMFFITSFFASSNAFSTAGTVMGTLIGFITGIYLPIGMLPNSVQWLVKLFPTSHAAALLRQTMMEGVMAESFANVPEQYLMDFKHMLGVTFQFGTREVGSSANIAILLISAGIFFLLAVMKLSPK